MAKQDERLRIFSKLRGKGSVEASLPPTVRCLSFQETMDTCLKHVGGSIAVQAGGGHELLSDLNATKALCQAGKLQDAMSCLEQVYNDCAAVAKSFVTRPNSLNPMLDIGKWRSGMERLCANIDYLRQHEECTRVIAVESSHCIQRESQLFMAKSARVVARAMKRGKTGQRQLMDLGCKFASNVIWCFQDPLDKEKSCPCQYRHLVVDVVWDSIPPFCKPDVDYYYNFNDCVNDDTGFDDMDGAAGGSSGADTNDLNTLHNVMVVQQNPSGGAIQYGTNSGPKENPGFDVVREPQLAGKEGEYKVEDVAMSQGHTGRGSVLCPPFLALEMLVGLAASLLVVSFL